MYIPEAQADWEVAPRGTWLLQAPTARGIATTGIDTLGLACTPEGEPFFYIYAASHTPLSGSQEAVFRVQVDDLVMNLSAERISGETTFYGTPPISFVGALLEGTEMTLELGSYRREFPLVGAASALNQAMSSCMPELF